MMFYRKMALTGLAWSLALLMSAPIFWMALMAFKTNFDAMSFSPNLFFRPTLENFAVSAVARPILNSVLVAGGGTALCFLFALPAAHALAFGSTKRNAILLGMLMTRFMPSMGMMIPVYLIYRDIGLLDTRSGLALIYALTNLPIVIWMLYSYMREIPPAILDNAKIDGAAPAQQLLFILLPLCAPGICSTALLAVILCWNEAFWSIELTSSEAAPISAYIATLSGDMLWPQLSSASLLAVGPILLLGWLTQRQLVRGLTFGAVR